MDKLYTFLAASKLAGVDVKTLRRHLAKGRITAVETPFGPRLTLETIQSYLGQVGAPSPVPNEGESASLETHPEALQGTLEASEGLQSSIATPSPFLPSPSHSMPEDGFIKAIEVLEKHLDRVTYLFEAERVRAEKAERGKLALENQLAQYTRALAESAESLSEERAKRVTAQAQAAQPKSIWGKLRRMMLPGKAQTG